jgi:hypothetical protein
MSSKIQQTFFGVDPLKFFIGVVENRRDPLKLGRVQVRLQGFHCNEKIPSDANGHGVATDDLPWAYPLQSITSAAINGIGDSPTGVVEGTWVFGFSRDGEFMNDLVIVGTFGGIPQDGPNPNLGFNDPNGVYPKSDFIGEPDTNRLTRNEKIDETIVKKKRDGQINGVKKANGKGTWNEPKVPYNAVYPFNHVYESESGHIQEWDDTKGAERVHTYHKSGTFHEIHPDGSEMTKVVGDDYEIVIKDKNVHIKGSCNVNIVGDTTLFVQGDVEEQITGNINRVVGGNVTEYVKGSKTTTVDGNVTEITKGRHDNSVSGNITYTGSNIFLN